MSRLYITISFVIALLLVLGCAAIGSLQPRILAVLPSNHVNFHVKRASLSGDSTQIVYSHPYTVISPNKQEVLLKLKSPEADGEGTWMIGNDPNDKLGYTVIYYDCNGQPHDLSRVGHEAYISGSAASVACLSHSGRLVIKAPDHTIGVQGKIGHTYHAEFSLISYGNAGEFGGSQTNSIYLTAHVS